MQSKLSKLIQDLPKDINGDKIQIINTIFEIDKYFEDELSKASMIGKVLRAEKIISPPVRVTLKPLIQFLMKEPLKDYFEGRKNPPKQDPIFLTWSIVGLSVLLFVFGIVRLGANVVGVGLGTKYNTVSVFEGGTPILFGMLLMLIAVTRFKHEKARKRIASDLRSE